MLFYQVHCVAWFFPTFQNTLLHQTEHGKLPQTNTQPQSVLLISFIAECRYSSLAEHHFKTTTLSMFRLTEKKYLCSGNKEDFDEMDFLDFFCLCCHEVWQYSSLILRLLKLTWCTFTAKTGNEFKTKLWCHTFSSCLFGVDGKKKLM